MGTVDEADRTRHASCFVTHLSKSFIQRIDPEYQRKIKGRGLTNAILGVIIVKFAKIISESVDLVNNASQRKKAKTIGELLESCNREKLYEILVKGGKEVFKSYEEALTKISLHDLKKVAEDASVRVLHYIISDRCTEFSVETIWKGVLEGSSELSNFGKIGRTVRTKEHNPENISKSKKQKGKFARITSGAFRKIAKSFSNQPKRVPEQPTAEINSSDMFLYSQVLILSDEFPYVWNLYGKDQKRQFDYLPYRLACDGEDVKYLESIGYQLMPSSSSTHHEDSYRDQRITERTWSNIVPTVVAELLLGKETIILNELVTDVGNALNVIHDKFDENFNDLASTIEVTTIVLNDKIDANFNDIRNRIADIHNVLPEDLKKIPLLPLPPPDKNFTGKPDLCPDVHDKILPSRNVDGEANQHQDTLVVCLHGHKKPQTARKIVSLCNLEINKFAEVIIIEAESEEEIRLKITCVLKNQTQELEYIHPDTVQLVHKLFDLLKSRNDERFVVVFDNITTDLAKKCLPLNMGLKNVAIILTSLEEIDLPNTTVTNFHIDILQPSDARDLLMKRVNCRLSEDGCRARGKIDSSGFHTSDDFSSHSNHNYTTVSIINEIKDEASMIDSKFDAVFDEVISKYPVKSEIKPTVPSKKEDFPRPGLATKKSTNYNCSYKNSKSPSGITRMPSMASSDLEFPKIPQSVEEFFSAFEVESIRQRFGHCSNDLFFQGCIGNEMCGRCGIFYTRRLLEFFDSTKHEIKAFADATFLYQPTYFQQIFIVHFQIGNYTFPAFYVFMEKKSAAAYQCIFETISSLGFKIVELMADFETAIKDAFLAVYPSATVFGCYFHLAQALLRQMRKSKTERVDLNLLRILSALAFLPPEDIEPTFHKIKTKYCKAKNKKYFKYFEDYWIKKVGPAGFSIFGRDQITNNVAESFHELIKNFNGVLGDASSNSKLWELMDQLIKIHHRTEIEMETYAKSQFTESMKKSTINKNRLNTLYSHMRDSSKDFDILRFVESLHEHKFVDYVVYLENERKNLEDYESDSDIDSSSEGETDSDPNCVVCLTNRRSYIYNKCSHFVLCSDCAEILRQENYLTCVICRAVNTKIKRVYT